MGVIHVENVEDRIMNAIRLRADLSGRSFEEEVRAILDDVPLPRMISSEDRNEEARRIREMTPSPADSEALWADLDTRSAEWARIRAMTPNVPQTDSTEIIRELRDTRHAGG